MAQAIFTPDLEFVVFSGMSPAPERTGIRWDFSDVTKPKTLVCFERHNSTGPWRKMDISDSTRFRPSKFSRNKGTINLDISVGDKYSLRIYYSDEEIDTSIIALLLNEKNNKDEPYFHLEMERHKLKRLSEVSISTINKTKSLVSPYGDGSVEVFHDPIQTKLTFSRAIYDASTFIKIWFTDDKIQLDSNGYIDPNEIIPERGFLNFVLESNSSINFINYPGDQTFYIQGRYPGKRYHTVVLYCDKDGSYNYNIDFDFNNEGLPPIFDRHVSCKLKRLWLSSFVALGQIGSESYHAKISMYHGLSARRNPSVGIWNSSLTNRSVLLNNSADFPLLEGNLSEELLLVDRVTGGDYWRIFVNAEMTSDTPPSSPEVYLRGEIFEPSLAPWFLYGGRIEPLLIEYDIDDDARGGLVPISFKMQVEFLTKFVEL
jgi:hypothetical protein